VLRLLIVIYCFPFDLPHLADIRQLLKRYHMLDKKKGEIIIVRRKAQNFYTLSVQTPMCQEDVSNISPLKKIWPCCSCWTLGLHFSFGQFFSTVLCRQGLRSRRQMVDTEDMTNLWSTGHRWMNYLSIQRCSTYYNDTLKSACCFVSPLKRGLQHLKDFQSGANFIRHVFHSFSL
jgi:hypothetical protein